jgi:hypothetical protein
LRSFFLKLVLNFSPFLLQFFWAILLILEPRVFSLNIFWSCEVKSFKFNYTLMNHPNNVSVCNKIWSLEISANGIGPTLYPLWISKILPSVIFILSVINLIKWQIKPRDCWIESTIGYYDWKLAQSDDAQNKIDTWQDLRYRAPLTQSIRISTGTILLLYKL